MWTRAVLTTTCAAGVAAILILFVLDQAGAVHISGNPVPALAFAVVYAACAIAAWRVFS